MVPDSIFMISEKLRCIYIHIPKTAGVSISKALSENNENYINLSGQKKNEALYDSDVVVQLSRQEQGAWAPIEAVLCETPIIVTANTGSGEDVSRLNAGTLVNFGQIEEFSNSLNYIFFHHI